MRAGGLVAALLLVGLVSAGSALAACPLGTPITLTAAGPSPSSATVTAGFPQWFTKTERGVTASVVFEDASCRIDFAAEDGPNLYRGCDLKRAGTYHFRVTGFGAGEGIVVVRSSVTIDGPPETTVVFGQKLRISGSTFASCGPPSMLAGDVPVAKLQLLAQPFARDEGRLAAATAFGPGGSWTYAARPLIRTVYRVLGPPGPSDPLTVDVRPRLRLHVVSKRPRILSTRADSLASYTGSSVVLQRWSNRAGQWMRVRSIRLGAKGEARFRAPRLHGAVRVYMPESDAGPGYVEGFSNVLNLRRP